MNKLGTLLFGELAPDQPAFNPSGRGGERAINVMPRLHSYGPLPDYQPITTTPLDSRCVGAISVTDDVADIITTFTGTASTLYQKSGPSWIARGTGYSADRWEFAQWDNKTVVGVTYNSIPQSRLIAGANDFTDLFADNVKARRVATWRYNLAFGDISDADGNNSNRVRWTGYNDITTITPSTITLAGFQDLEGDHGPITKLVSGTTGMVFRRSGIHRASFVGSPLVYRFDLMESKVGAITGGSVLRYGNNVFFLAQDGFRVMTPDTASVPIGEEKIDRTVLADLDLSFRDNMSVALFEAEQVVVWSYPGRGNSAGISNQLVMYNMATNKWATGEQVAEFIFNYASQGASIDEIDHLDEIGEGTDNPVYGSYDDRQWSGGGPVLGVFFNDHNLGSMTGPNKTALFQTAEVEPNPGGKTFINYIRPIVENAPIVKAYMGYRNRQEDVQQFIPAAIPQGIQTNEWGVVPIRMDARYISFVVEVEGGFQDALGVDFYGTLTGAR